MNIFTKAPLKPEYQCTHYFIDEQCLSKPIEEHIKKNSEDEMKETLEEIIQSINNSLIALDTCCEGDIPPTDNAYKYLKDARGTAKYLISEIERTKKNASTIK